MKLGTKSLLFGVHLWWLHPFFVAAAWTKLYGFPKDWRLWYCFFVHDLGYWGCSDMDGREGEDHPWYGAMLAHIQLDRSNVEWKWFDFCVLHSRFMALRRGRNPSQLCFADKLATVLIPWWLYLPLARLTGEIKEYKKTTGKADISSRQWKRNLDVYLINWVEEHKDGKFDWAGAQNGRDIYKTQTAPAPAPQAARAQQFQPWIPDED